MHMIHERQEISTAVIDLGDEADESLARRARGDPQAFTELYRRYLNRVYRFHLLRTGNQGDAQDLTSQTFLAALEALPGYRGQGSFCSWLFGIAAHKAADYYRKWRGEIPLEWAASQPSGEPSPENITVQRLEYTRVANALLNLPVEQAQALTLRVFGELSAAEIGHLMSRSEAAIRMLVYRGLRQLHSTLVSLQEVKA